MSIKEEESVAVEDGLSIPEMRQLHELQGINMALNREEFMEIVLVYKKAIDRISKEAAKQGIKI